PVSNCLTQMARMAMPLAVSLPVALARLSARRSPWAMSRPNLRQLARRFLLKYAATACQLRFIPCPSHHTITAKDDLLMAKIYYTEDHEWLSVEGNIGTVGISDYAEEQLGDLVFVDLPEVGREVSKGDATVVVESVKAASDVYAVVDGE